MEDWEHQHLRWRKVKPRGAAEHVARIRDTWAPRSDALLTEERGAAAKPNG
jgi:glutamate synthase (NADPH/NADH) large chain/glutamate synthase (ferredoxin)